MIDCSGFRNEGASNEVNPVQKIIVEKSENGLLDTAYNSLNVAVSAQNVTSIRPILRSKPGIIGSFVVFIKKIIRRLLKWYIEPVCENQKVFNQAISSCNEDILSCVGGIATYYEEKNEELRMKFLEYEERLVISNTELASIKEEINIVKEQVPELFSSIQNNWCNYACTSQSGEDKILAYIFTVLGVDIKKEFYLDLGANHAKELSNTYMFYKLGMRGVLVEANPSLIPELRFYRSEDIVINKCVASEGGKNIRFYVMNGDGLSCPDRNSIDEAIRINPTLRIENEIEVESITVNEIVEKYFVKPPLFVNVDIEGTEEEILRNYDYERYAPLCIIVERIDYSLSIATKKRNDDIDLIMRENGYFEYAFTGINSIYINKSRLEGSREKAL